MDISTPSRASTVAHCGGRRTWGKHIGGRRIRSLSDRARYHGDRQRIMRPGLPEVQILGHRSVDGAQTRSSRPPSSWSPRNSPPGSSPGTPSIRIQHNPNPRAPN
ncbi:hypothetical protein NUW54_g14162 [Trametes sanguinea]|uniref:Uncharacterized protein n=1 Tax=Trametes sanguinea TaxID=158606 RepID=A0ACC1MGD7_9APHY|nr:hypothetical protein NUW54_g14162 [Trametes sanguinea]